MPGSSCVARMSGCTGTEGLVGTTACNSCNTLLRAVEVGDHEPRHVRER